MPEWLAITLGLCACALTIVQVLVRTGMWAGSVEARTQRDDRGLQHQEIVAELRSIREDTQSMRSGLHNVTNAITGMSAVIEIMKTDYERRRR